MGSRGDGGPKTMGWCLGGVRVGSSPELGKVLIAEGSFSVFLAWKPGRLGSDAYSTRHCRLVFSKYFGCCGVFSCGWLLEIRIISIYVWKF